MIWRRSPAPPTASERQACATGGVPRKEAAATDWRVADRGIGSVRHGRGESTRRGWTNALFEGKSWDLRAAHGNNSRQAVSVVMWK